MLHILDPNPL